MATWEDGPEYAPVLRPDHFAEPQVAPLSAAPPPPQNPYAPAERPAFDHPRAPVAPLQDLVPPIADPRDPTVPFEVASATLTDASSAWSAAHWSAPTGPPALGDWPSASQAPAPFPGPVASGAPQPGPFPAPGTTEWFAPPPMPYAPAAVPGGTGPKAISRALTPAVIICLALGGVVWPLAPISFLIAFGLVSRMQVARAATVTLFASVLGLLVIVGVLEILLGDGLLGEWWTVVARWAQVLSWITLVIAWIVVWQGLRTRPRDPGPSPTVWG